MKMTGTLTTGAGCSLNLESGGDLEIAGWSGANALAINMTAGRLENTGAMSNVDLTIGSEFTGAYYVPGIFILDEGSSLTPNNLTLTGNAVVAFDGSAGGTATLTLAGTTTFAYEAMTGKRYPLEQASAEGSTGGDGPQSGKILKMQAGIHGAQAPNVIANVVLGGDLAVDVTGLASGIYDLIDVDSVTGSFESTTITGGSGTINVTTTKVQLTI